MLQDFSWSLVYLGQLLVALKASVLDANCTTYMESGSTTVDVTCDDKGGTMIACEVHSLFEGLIGSKITNNSCTVSSVHTGQQITASYRCCNLTNTNDDNNINNKYSLQCIDRESQFSNNFDGIATVSCFSDETLLGCTGYTKDYTTITQIWGNCVGSECPLINGTKENDPQPNIFKESNNVCYSFINNPDLVKLDATGGLGNPLNQSVFARARCCKIIDNSRNNKIAKDIGLTCDTIWGNRSITIDDAFSNVACTDNYGFLSDCNGINNGGTFDGILSYTYDYFITRSGSSLFNPKRCFAFNGFPQSGISNDYGVISQALCCNIQNISMLTTTIATTKSNQGTNTYISDNGNITIDIEDNDNDSDYNPNNVLSSLIFIIIVISGLVVLFLVICLVCGFYHKSWDWLPVYLFYICKHYKRRKESAKVINASRFSKSVSGVDTSKVGIGSRSATCSVDISTIIVGHDKSRVNRPPKPPLPSSMVANNLPKLDEHKQESYKE